jgi:three-Cys-motif partner protein
MDEVYDGREQTRAKHDLLRRYLEPFAYKILQGFRSLDFVDCFAGPWKNRDLSNFSDTSFGIALEILNKVQEEIRKSGKQANVTCIFNEADDATYAQLARFVQDASVRYPNIKIFPLQGTFAENAARINSLAKNNFRLVYVDPTGWTGYPLEALRLAVPPKNSEVMINFMSSFIQRFLRDPEDRRNAWLTEMLGQRRAMENAEKKADEAKIRELIAETLREDLKLEYVCQSPIAHRESRQTPPPQRPCPASLASPARPRASRRAAPRPGWTARSSPPGIRSGSPS